MLILTLKIKPLNLKANGTIQTSNNVKNKHIEAFSNKIKII